MGDIDRDGVEKAYGRWAPVYDLVFGKVFDQGRQSTIAERLATRRHRYMPATLLGSQFAALEPPLDAVVVDVDSDTATQVRKVLDALRLSKHCATAFAGSGSPHAPSPPRESTLSSGDE